MPDTPPPNKIRVEFTGNLPEGLAALRAFLVNSGAVSDPAPEKSEPKGSGAGDRLMALLTKLMSTSSLPAVECLSHSGNPDADGFPQRLLIYGVFALSNSHGERRDQLELIGCANGYAAAVIEHSTLSWKRHQTLYFFDQNVQQFVYAILYVRVDEPDVEGYDFNMEDIPDPAGDEVVAPGPDGGD